MWQKKAILILCSAHESVPVFLGGICMSFKLKNGDKIELDIVDLTSEGSGVGKIEKMAIFVPETVTGDKVLVKINKIKKNYALGEVVELIEPSQDRVQPKCSFYDRCGGCQLQHISYQSQLEIKTKQVYDALERIGKIKDVKVHPTIGMKEPYRYRNKGEFPVGMENGQVSIGCFKRKSHDVVNVDSCIIQSEISERIIEEVRRYMNEYNVPPFDEKRRKGIIRHVLIRTAKDNSCMVVVVTNGENLPYREKLVERLKDVAGVSSIYQNINKRRTPVVLGYKSIKLYGKDKIIDYIDEFKFYISPNSFFQVNSQQTEVLYSKVLEYLDLKGGETVFDLYSGIGTISLFLSQKAKKVYGIEVVKQAVEDARENAKLNNIENVEFICGTSEEVFPKMIKDGMIGHSIVVDPPRKGCEKEVLDGIVKMNPKNVVYVSCNPSTLARDLNYLVQNNYKVIEAQPIDMFPFSTHCEVVVKLERE